MLEDKEKKMAIGRCSNSGGNSVNVYNERGVMLFSKVGELIGYTGTTVTIRRGNQAITYSDKGIQKILQSVFLTSLEEAS